MVSRQRILPRRATLTGIGARRWPRSPRPPASDARRSIAISRRARTCRPRSPGADDAIRAPRSRRAVATLPYQAPGRLGRDRPLALEVTHVLDEVPPHLIADQLVAEARRAAGVPSPCTSSTSMARSSSGSRAQRTSPRRSTRRRRSGPRSCPRGCRALRGAASAACRAASPAPLWLRGRVIGLLLCVGAPRRGDRGHRQAGRRCARARQRLHRPDRGGAPAQADDRRRRGPVPSAPAAHRPHHRRAARRRRCCPSYEVGGDWFDFVENRDGAWLAIADAAGTGPPPPA